MKNLIAPFLGIKPLPPKPRLVEMLSRRRRIARAVHERVLASSHAGEDTLQHWLEAQAEFDARAGNARR